MIKYLCYFYLTIQFHTPKNFVNIPSSLKYINCPKSVDKTQMKKQKISILLKFNLIQYDDAMYNLYILLEVND